MTANLLAACLALGTIARAMVMVAADMQHDEEADTTSFTLASAHINASLSANDGIFAITSLSLATPSGWTVNLVDDGNGTAPGQRSTTALLLAGGGQGAAQHPYVAHVGPNTTFTRGGGGTMVAAAGLELRTVETGSRVLATEDWHVWLGDGGRSLWWTVGTAEIYAFPEQASRRPVRVER